MNQEDFNIFLQKLVTDEEDIESFNILYRDESLQAAIWNILPSFQDQNTKGKLVIILNRCIRNSNLNEIIKSVLFQIQDLYFIPSFSNTIIELFSHCSDSINCNELIALTSRIHQIRDPNRIPFEIDLFRIIFGQVANLSPHIKRNLPPSQINMYDRMYNIILHILRTNNFPQVHSRIIKAICQFFVAFGQYFNEKLIEFLQFIPNLDLELWNIFWESISELQSLAATIFIPYLFNIIEYLKQTPDRCCAILTAVSSWISDDMDIVNDEQVEVIIQLYLYSYNLLYSENTEVSSLDIYNIIRVYTSKTPDRILSLMEFTTGQPNRTRIWLILNLYLCALQNGTYNFIFYDTISPQTMISSFNEELENIVQCYDLIHLTLKFFEESRLFLYMMPMQLIFLSFQNVFKVLDMLYQSESEDILSISQDLYSILICLSDANVPDMLPFAMNYFSNTSFLDDASFWRFLSNMVSHSVVNEGVAAQLFEFIRQVIDYDQKLIISCFDVSVHVLQQVRFSQTATDFVLEIFNVLNENITEMSPDEIALFCTSLSYALDNDCFPELEINFVQIKELTETMVNVSTFSDVNYSRDNLEIRLMLREFKAGNLELKDLIMNKLESRINEETSEANIITLRQFKSFINPQSTLFSFAPNFEEEPTLSTLTSNDTNGLTSFILYHYAKMCTFYIRHRNEVSSAAFLADACNLLYNTSPEVCLSPQCALSFVVIAAALENVLNGCNGDLEQFNALVYGGKNDGVDDSILSSSALPGLIAIAKRIAHHPLLAEIAANERFAFQNKDIITKPEVWNISILARNVIDGAETQELTREILDYCLSKPWKAPCSALICGVAARKSSLLEYFGVENAVEKMLAGHPHKKANCLVFDSVVLLLQAAAGNERIVLACVTALARDFIIGRSIDNRGGDYEEELAYFEAIPDNLKLAAFNQLLTDFPECAATLIGRITGQ